MECQLNENRGSPDPAHLTNGGGGNCLYQIRDRIERKIKALCQEAGLETPFTIARELEKLQKQQALDIPWTTSCIEQLLGTEPITYTLVSIRSDR